MSKHLFTAKQHALKTSILLKPFVQKEDYRIISLTMAVSSEIKLRIVANVDKQLAMSIRHLKNS